MNELSWADVTAGITPLEPHDLDGLITMKPPSALAQGSRKTRKTRSLWP